MAELTLILSGLKACILIPYTILLCETQAIKFHTAIIILITALLFSSENIS